MARGKVIHLEDIYRHPLGALAPTLINDFKVLAHNIYQFCLAQEHIQGFEDIRDQYIEASWAYKLNRGPSYLGVPPTGWLSITVDDVKPYWRHLECERLGLEPYKGSRGPHPEDFKHLCQLGLDYMAKANLPVFREQGFEADDWAGAVHRLKLSASPESNLARRAMFLVTVDGDWMMLVSSEHKLYWANTGPWVPRLRGDSEVADHTLKKTGMRIARPRDLAKVKEQVGDLGDNLFKGSPLALYDLCNANSNPEYQLELKPDFARLKETLEIAQANSKPSHVTQSLNWILSKGLAVPN